MSKRSINKNTIVVPASPEGFANVFLKKKTWYAFRASQEVRSRLKFICVYQTKPVSAITHIAEIAEISRYCESKYSAKLKPESIREVGPIRYDSRARSAIQSPRYFDLRDILNAKSLKDLVG